MRFVGAEGALPFAHVKISGGEVAFWNVTTPLQGDPADTAQSIEISEGAGEEENPEEVRHVVPVVDLPVRGTAAR